MRGTTETPSSPTSRTTNTNNSRTAHVRESRVVVVSSLTMGSSRNASTAASAKGISTGWRKPTACPKRVMSHTATAPPATMAR